jgi:hypothetical protein
LVLFFSKLELNFMDSLYNKLPTSSWLRGFGYCWLVLLLAREWWPLELEAIRLWQFPFGSFFSSGSSHSLAVLRQLPQLGQIDYFKKLL